MENNKTIEERGRGCRVHFAVMTCETKLQKGDIQSAENRAILISKKNSSLGCLQLGSFTFTRNG